MKKGLWIGIGTAALIVGGLLVFVYLNNMREMAIAGALGAVIFLVGGYLIYRSLTGGFEVSNALPDKEKVKAQKYNSLVGEALQMANGVCIPKRLKLEKIEKPEQYGGIQIKVQNNKQAYYLFTRITPPPVNGVEPSKPILAPYILQDTKYYSPRTVAIYWGLAGIKEAFNLHEDPLKLIGPGMIVVGMIIAFVAMVVI